MQHIHMHMLSGQQHVFWSRDIANMVHVMWVTVNRVQENAASMAEKCGPFTADVRHSYGQAPWVWSNVAHRMNFL